MCRISLILLWVGLLQAWHGYSSPVAANITALEFPSELFDLVPSQDRRQMDRGDLSYIREGGGIVLGGRSSSGRGFFGWRIPDSRLLSGSSTNQTLQVEMDKTKIWYLHPDLSEKIKNKYEQLIRDRASELSVNVSDLDYVDPKVRTDEQIRLFEQAVDQVGEKEDLSGFHPEMRNAILGSNTSIWQASPVGDSGFVAEEMIWHFNDASGQLHNFVVWLPSHYHHFGRKMSLTQAASFYKSLMERVEEISGVNLEEIEEYNLRSLLMSWLFHFVDRIGIETDPNK